MYRTTRTLAGKSNKSVGRARARSNKARQASGAAGDCISLVTGEVIQRQPIKFVTIKPKKSKRRKRQTLLFQGSIS